MEKDNSRSLALEIINCIKEKQGEDVTMLSIGEKSIICDYFIIASGNSPIQVKAIADKIMERCKELGKNLFKISGYNEGLWVIIDLLDIVVHIFSPMERTYYNLEDFWKGVSVEKF
ncbi:iojap-like protein [Thermodesulfobium narugense DSM 14796]|uniref:Ribosomal silencing factor RsfS n=1 Tax=Thermodesulfobium narugense DSM 14796 TaxID=747365 RepID=M1E8G8_9BACT|nr:ribosome silencing factor [Thermodesulfobium narugense]AEE14935.1 iojap-like protein [Thermodesulfobium narugense DSM 14796]